MLGGDRYVDEIETPAAVVDLDRLAGNVARAATYAERHGLSLRPHVKTHKSERVALMQLEAGSTGLTCATPYEAEVMSQICDDILVAYPPADAVRARRLAALPENVTLTVALDSVESIHAMDRAAFTTGRTVKAYVELDLGMHRVGVRSSAAAIALAREVDDATALEFDGIAFYPGHIRAPVGEQSEALRKLDSELRETVERFNHAGLSPRVVSGGSTPTLWRTHELSSVTEFRPGTYVYNDRTTALVGACEWSDCALTVLSTVVSTAVPGQAVIDAGSKSLGREPIRGADGEGFGQLLEHPEVVVKSMSEEHGILDLSATEWRPRVGDRVRVIPNHVCIVVHLNDIVYGIRESRVETSWPVSARGRGYVPVG